MYDSIDTILCVYLNFFLQICLQYSTDVDAVVETNSIHSIIHSFISVPVNRLTAIMISWKRDREKHQTDNLRRL